MINRSEFTREDLAFICLNIKGTENIDISEQLGFTKRDDLNRLSDKLSSERMKELNKYNDSKYFLDKYYRTDYGMYNPFQECISANHDKFMGGLLGNGLKPQLSWKATCKELLVESIKVYCTPYKKEYYMKDKEGNLQYIGNDFEAHLENLYSMIDFNYTTLIPFSSFFPTIKKHRVYDSLMPNRDYILFDDCLLNINTGEQLLPSSISEDAIPFIIIDYEYSREDFIYQDYVKKLFERIDTDNQIKSLMYGMFNKRVLKKSSAIFNIQKSNTGKTLLLTPFLLMGVFTKVKKEMLQGHEQIGLFGQYYTIFFEEMQDSLLLANAFNELLDDNDTPVTRKYKDPIKVPREIKPVVVVNGESMPQFKGRTKGTDNRMSFIPNYKEPLNESDYEILNPSDRKEAIAVGVEIIRALIEYMQEVSQETIIKNIEKSRKTEAEIMKLKENKLDITFRYIEQEPNNIGDAHCISITILIEMIKEIQARGEITVDLFNADNSIRSFIQQAVIPSLDTEIEAKETSQRQIKKQGKWKTSTLKFILQLTEDGKELVQKLGYDLDSLKY